MDKRSGLIRPPQGLVDRLTAIGRGATAKYWLDREERERGQKCLDQEDIDGFEWVIGDIDDLCRNIRKGEVSLEDVKWTFQASLNTTKVILDKCASVGLTIPALTTERVILAHKKQEAALIFEDERSYRNELAGLVSRLEAILIKTLKTLVGEPLFSDTMREQYLEASAQVEHNDQQSWVVSDSFLGEVRLNLIIKRTPTLGSYVYRGSQHTLLLYVHPGRVGYDLGEIRDVVRHELVHAMQKQISLNNEVAQAGLPRSKSGVYHQGMREKEKELKVEYARKGLDPEDVSIHALDDIEFYSRLLDEVVNFQRIMGSNPSNADIHNHISRRLFFKSLKRQPKKWRKAVGIFSSEVMSRNVRRASEFKTPRKWSKAHCESKSCDEMGFSEKASCRPYKNCYTPKSTSKRSHIDSSNLRKRLEHDSRDVTSPRPPHRQPSARTAAFSDFTKTASAEVVQLQQSLEQRFEGLTLMLTHFSESNILRINAISFPKDKRKQGAGSQVMTEIVAWADTHNAILSLTPSKDFGASSVGRLEKFYRRFGFKPNKGRNKDFRTRDTMLRYPATTRVASLMDRYSRYRRRKP